MRLTPRADEVAAIAAVLDQNHESAEAAAKAVIKAVAELLQMRDWVALAHTWGDQPSGLNFGPFGNEAEALAFIKQVACGGEVGVVKLHGAGLILADVDGKKGLKTHCLNPLCGHAGWAHLADGSTRGKCAIPSCRCLSWTNK